MPRMIAKAKVIAKGEQMKKMETKISRIPLKSIHPAPGACSFRKAAYAEHLEIPVIIDRIPSMKAMVVPMT